MGFEFRAGVPRRLLSSWVDDAPFLGAFLVGWGKDRGEILIKGDGVTGPDLAGRLLQADEQPFQILSGKGYHQLIVLSHGEDAFALARDGHDEFPAAVRADETGGALHLAGEIAADPLSHAESGRLDETHELGRITIDHDDLGR